MASNMKKYVDESITGPDGIIWMDRWNERGMALCSITEKAGQVSGKAFGLAYAGPRKCLHAYALAESGARRPYAYLLADGGNVIVGTEVPADDEAMAGALLPFVGKKLEYLVGKPGDRSGDVPEGTDDATRLRILAGIPADGPFKFVPMFNGVIALEFAGLSVASFMPGSAFPEESFMLQYDNRLDPRMTEAVRLACIRTGAAEKYEAEQDAGDYGD